jgi:ABC-type phosphate transport system substrate-binding protein
MNFHFAALIKCLRFLLENLLIQQKSRERGIAYDGLVVIVAFSYSQRENSLPASLNGQITFEQLRKLYTGEINNWRDLGGPDLPVKLYIPDETEAVRIFEQRVLKNDEKINAFRNLQRKEDQANWVTTSWLRVITRVANSQKMLQSVIQDFEKADANKQIGAIAFSRLSQVFGQCSVYPLALVEGEKDPVQPLIQDNGQPINPTTDLCNDKGSYHPNFQVFKDRSYPLAYPLAVVYPRDNSRPPVGAKFADMLRTQEGQQLLGKTGLVPLYSVTRP